MKTSYVACIVLLLVNFMEAWAPVVWWWRIAPIAALAISCYFCGRHAELRSSR